MEEISAGLPAGDMGRISFDIYKGSGRTDPTIVYAIVEASTGGGGRGGAGRRWRSRRWSGGRTSDTGAAGRRSRALSQHRWRRTLGAAVDAEHAA
jgi:hypothetical protein